jgi:hypothetical protein
MKPSCDVVFPDGFFEGLGVLWEAAGGLWSLRTVAVISEVMLHCRGSKRGAAMHASRPEKEMTACRLPSVVQQRADTADGCFFCVHCTLPDE